LEWKSEEWKFEVGSQHLSLAARLRLNLIFANSARSIRRLESVTQGEVSMSGQVILYFEDQADALRFALAAGSVMSGDGTRATDDLVQETARVTRILLDAADKGKNRQLNPPECAA
jgi:hypothetical protein